MQIFIKTLEGVIKQLEVEASDTVQDIKERIQEITGLPASQQRLIFAGKQLDDSRVIGEYNIQKETTIFLARRLIGG